MQPSGWIPRRRARDCREWNDQALVLTLAGLCCGFHLGVQDLNALPEIATLGQELRRRSILTGEPTKEAIRGLLPCSRVVCTNPHLVLQAGRS